MGALRRQSSSQSSSRACCHDPAGGRVQLARFFFFFLASQIVARRGPSPPPPPPPRRSPPRSSVKTGGMPGSKSGYPPGGPPSRREGGRRSRHPPPVAAPRGRSPRGWRCSPSKARPFISTPRSATMAAFAASALPMVTNRSRACDRRDRSADGLRTTGVTPLALNSVSRWPGSRRTRDCRLERPITRSGRAGRPGASLARVAPRRLRRKRPHGNRAPAWSEPSSSERAAAACSAVAECDEPESPGSSGVTVLGSVTLVTVPPVASNSCRSTSSVMESGKPATKSLRSSRSTCFAILVRLFSLRAHDAASFESHDNFGGSAGSSHDSLARVIPARKGKVPSPLRTPVIPPANAGPTRHPLRRLDVNLRVIVNPRPAAAPQATNPRNFPGLGATRAHPRRTGNGRTRRRPAAGRPRARRRHRMRGPGRG